METQTFRIRLASLIQKSRKALRLYNNVGNNVGRSLDGANSEFAVAQVNEWRAINAHLLKKLTDAMEQLNNRKLISDIFAIRNEFHSDWRMAESELFGRQKELISSAEKGDFIKAAVLSTQLITLKARVQACQAAHHELDTLVKKSRVVPPTIELSDDHMIPEEPKVALAKVIPLRRGI